MIWLIAGGVILAGAALWGPIASQVEHPAYTVVAAPAEAIEIRDYGPTIVAETDVAGEREAAIGNGFRAIADYIFGNNAAHEKIAMTAPVTQAPTGDARWTVRFVMPRSFTLESLPPPANPAVRLRQMPAQRVAVITFSGNPDATELAAHAAELVAALRARQIEPLSPPTYAFYNPPWTLPFLKRNEIMVEVPG